MAKPTRFRNKWRIRWYDEHGKRRSQFYDDKRDAAFKLREHEQLVEEVHRKLRSPSPPKKTFSDLCDYWIANRAKVKRSGKHDESIIRRHLRPALGALPVGDLGVKHVDGFVAQQEKLDPKTVHNHLTLLIAMLNVALDLGWIVKIPRIRKPKVRIFDSDFRFLRTDEEIARFLRAARDEGEAVFVLYAAAVYTGMRAGELAGLRWDDVSLERRLITVQRSFEGPTKAGDVRYVPILDPLLPVLRAWQRLHPGRLVFTNRVATGRDRVHFHRRHRDPPARLRQRPQRPPGSHKRTRCHHRRTRAGCARVHARSAGGAHHRRRTPPTPARVGRHRKVAGRESRHGWTADRTAHRPRPKASDDRPCRTGRLSTARAARRPGARGLRTGALGQANARPR